MEQGIVVSSVIIAVESATVGENDTNGKVLRLIGKLVTIKHQTYEDNTKNC